MSYSRARSVAELDCEGAVVLAESAHVHGHPDRHVARPVDQNGMEIRAMEREAGSNVVPDLGEIDLDEQPAAVVAETLPSDHDRPLRHRPLEPSVRRAWAAFPGR
jgi:hypothetical protein